MAGSAFTEKLGPSGTAPGSWQLEFDPATPEEILDLSAEGFERVVVTPTRVPTTAMAPDDILDKARYVGLLRRRESRTTWGGPGLAVLLGDEDGKGNVYLAPVDDVDLPKFDGTNPSWIRTRIMHVGGDGANGLTIGDIVSRSSPSIQGNIEVGDTPRDLLEWICRAATSDKTNPQEYRVNPDGTVDQRNREALYPTTTAPTAIALRDGGAGSLSVAGSGLDLIPVVDFGTNGDWEDWSSKTTAVGPTVTLYGTPYTFSGDDQIAVNPFVGISGDPLIMERVVESNKAKSNADDEALAARVQGRHEKEARHLALTVDLYDLAEVAQVGDTIWVFDLADDLVKRANPVWVGCEVVYPAASRIVEATSPVRAGHGVYFCRWDRDLSEHRLVDLSDYIIPGTGPIRLGVGDPRRLLGVGRASRAA